jgi:probable rRNA maturation factor
MRLEIGIADPAWKKIAGLRKLARHAIEACLDETGVSLSVLFTGDKAMQALNLQWCGKDKPTNVLSFPAPPASLPTGEPRLLGDIVLAHGVVAAEAQAQNKSIHHHIAHLLVHGCLHLLGYDHENDRDAKAMETREIAILKRLGIDNPYSP